jgi:hypothetical protein
MHRNGSNVANRRRHWIATGLLAMAAWACTGAIDPALACECDVSSPPVTGEYSPEFIIEGTVINPPSFGSATMQVDRAWKGSFGKTVILEFGGLFPTNCDSPPPVGVPMLIVGRLDGSKSLSYNACSRVVAPDQPFRNALTAYKERTDTLEEQAKSGLRPDILAFADHLRVSGEHHRALDLYEQVLREHPEAFELLVPIALIQGVIDGNPQPALQRLRERAPDTEEWRRKVAYTAFEAACEIDPTRKDWSKVRSGGRCKIEGVDLKGANFDGADLSRVWFKDSPLEGASFRGANLFGGSFDGSSLIGAEYDCNTQYNARYFSPTAAGMIKVESECHAP